MALWKALRYAMTVVFLLVVGGIIAGAALGQPVFLTYVETGSMEPTLEPEDGFVAIPAELAGPIDEGDVIVFEAEAIQGGGLTTHRVVGETDRGFVTRGDANPFTDQDDDEPPVKEAQVVAVAWQPGGSVLVIPHLGTAVEDTQTVLGMVQRQIASLFGTRTVLGTRGLAYLFFAVALGWYVVGEWRARNTKETERVRSRDTGISTRLLIGLFVLLLVGAATAAMVVPAGTQQYDIVSAEYESDNPTVIPTGQSESFDRPLANGGLFPVVVYFEPASEGVDVQPRQFYLSSGERVNATLTLYASDETGYYRRFVTQYRYLAILPLSMIDSLYRFHPWAPTVIIDALVGIPFYLISVRLISTGRIRNRSRSRDLPLLDRFRQTLRKLY
jgi:signal peptidase